MRRALLVILALSGWAIADTGFYSTINIKTTDNQTMCQVGQIKVSPATLTCSGQVATITTGGGGGGGGSSSSTAISTGSATSSVIVSSPTTNLVFDNNVFKATLSGSTSAFMTLNSSSVTLQGPIVSSVSVNAITPGQISSVNASQINAGSLGTSVIASSVAVNAVGPAQTTIFGTSNTWTAPQQFSSSASVVYTGTTGPYDLAVGSSTNYNITVATGSGNIALDGVLINGNGLTMVGPAGGTFSILASGSNNMSLGDQNSAGSLMLGSSKTSTSMGSGFINTYGSLTTAGFGADIILGTVTNVVNSTLSITSTSLYTSVAATGSYTIRYYADERTPCATVAAGGVTFTFNWTDATMARSFTTPVLSADTTGLGTDYVQGALVVFAVGLSNITYTSTYSATCATGGPFSFDLHASVDRTQ